jgi:hypothetical protein
MTELSLPDPDTIRHPRAMIAIALVLAISFICFAFIQNNQALQDSHKPFVFTDSKTKYWLTYEDVLKDVNSTIELEYIARMDASNQGYTYVGYTFTIEKIGYYEGLELYTVHFQWWAIR